MGMNWFRMYYEARNDAKLRSLSDGQFRTWFNLLAFAAEQPERGLIAEQNTEVLAVEVANGDTELLEETLARLAKLQIIERTDDGICFIHFLERQYDKPSDRPAEVKERVKRSRDNAKRDVSPCNADVSPVQRAETQSNDTYTDSDSDIHPPISPRKRGECAIDPRVAKAFAAFWKAYPRKVAKQAAFKAFVKACPNGAAYRAIMGGLERFRASPDWERDDGRYIPYPATWLNGRRWEDEDIEAASSSAGALEFAQTRNEGAELAAIIRAKKAAMRAELEKLECPASA